MEKIAKEFAAQFNPADVFWLCPQEGSGSIKVEETLEFMERAYLACVGERKLMIISDAAAMTIAAQNKTLKVLEDAPANTVFLLLATSLEPVLNTIRSRCVIKFITTPPIAGELLSHEIKNTLKTVFNTEIDEKALSHEQRYAIMTVLAKINRNVAANCNAVNQMDLLIMEIMKYAKNR